MNKTLAQLRTALANMWGYENYSDLLTQDQADIDTIINSAYFDCFAPVDGTRPDWPVKYHSGILKAPVVVELGVTQGSAAVTGYTFEAAYLGSFVKIGEKFYRSASTTSFVQPWDGETGTVTATVYFNAIALPWSIVELEGKPNILGLGLLAPLPGPDAELQLRTEPAFDFYPRDTRRAFAAPRQAFRQSIYFDTGDPRYYHIDQASLGATFAIGNRLHVYPIPEKVYTFELRGNVVPNPLVDPAHIPEIPAQAVDNILLPIAREKLAKQSANRRYTGPNVAYLIDEADKARAQLKSMRRVQRDTGNMIRMRRGW